MEVKSGFCFVRTYLQTSSDYFKKGYEDEVIQT